MKLRLIALCLLCAPLYACDAASPRLADSATISWSGEKRVVLATPDIELSELTAGGVNAPRADWTEGAIAFTAKDVKDILAACALSAKYKQNTRTGSRRPCPFGPFTGFCFDLSLANEEGLEMRGRATARLQNGVLDLFVFTAPADYYFAEVSPAIDKIFVSVETK